MATYNVTTEEWQAIQKQAVSIFQGVGKALEQVFSGMSIQNRAMLESSARLFNAYLVGLDIIQGWVEDDDDDEGWEIEPAPDVDDDPPDIIPVPPLGGLQKIYDEYGPGSEEALPLLEPLGRYEWCDLQKKMYR